MTLEHDGRLDTLILAKDVDASDVATLHGLADVEQFRMSTVLLLDVVEPGDVITVLMVRVEPSCIDSAGCDRLAFCVNSVL